MFVLQHVNVSFLLPHIVWKDARPDKLWRELRALKHKLNDNWYSTDYYYN